HPPAHVEFGEAELLPLLGVGVIVGARAREHPAAALVHLLVDRGELRARRCRQRRARLALLLLLLRRRLVHHEAAALARLLRGQERLMRAAAHEETAV